MIIENLNEAKAIKALCKYMCEMCPHYDGVSYEISPCKSCYVDVIEEIANTSAENFEKRMKRK